MNAVTVPRVMHWWWDGCPPPPEYLEFRQRWVDLHPAWRLEIWNEQRWLTEFGSHPAAALYSGREQYSRYAHEWGWKTNIARYVLLEQYGGLWIDADLEPRKPVDPLIAQIEGEQAAGNALAAYEDTRHVNNAFLATPVGGAFISAVVDGLRRRVEAKRRRPSNVATGPHYLTDLHATQPGLVVLDRKLIYPMHWSELDQRDSEYPDAYTIHHWHRKTLENQQKPKSLVTGQLAQRGGAAPVAPQIRKRPQPTNRKRYGAVQRSGPSKGPSITSIPRAINPLKGLTPDNVMIALASFAVSVPRHQAIVELGVYKGKTTLMLAWGARQGKRAHVWGFDPWDLPGERFPWSELQNPTQQHRVEFTDPRTRHAAEYNVKSLGFTRDVTLARKFSVDAGQQWTGPKVGLLFIDGDHSYDAVRADLTAWAPHLAPGARIAFDDHAPTHPDVPRAVTDMVNAGILMPVTMYHDRLAVTRLEPRALEILANPPVATEAGPPHDPPVDDGGSELSSTPDPEPVAMQPEQPRDELAVRSGELDDAEPGTPLADLTITQLKVLCRARGIVLGARKDKRASILQALREGF